MPRSKRTIQAEDLAKALARQEAEKIAYVLREAQVIGDIDLKHHTIRVAVDIQSCEFLGNVDLKYCEFLQEVNLSGCTFHKDFNSGDEIESHTIYRKDLICRGTVFHKAATFNGCQIQGSAILSGATFNDLHRQVEFNAASIGKTLECDEVTFRGSVNFAGISCGSNATFDSARFESEKDVLFNSASLNSSLNCDNTVFKGRADFELLKCGGGGVFRRARFEGSSGANFVQASFGSNLECSRATFEGPAIFNTLQCEHAGFFVGTRFKDEAELGYAFFGGNLECSTASFEAIANFNSLECANLDCEEATFEGRANFNKLKCHNSGYFEHARFTGGGGVNFGYASFGNTLNCSNTLFEGFAGFGSLECSGSSFFHGARFRGSECVTFIQATIAGNLECRGAMFAVPAVVFQSTRCDGHGDFTDAQFNGIVDFRHASFGVSVILSASRFRKQVVLYGATADLIVLERDHFPFSGGLDLRGCSFKRFRGEENSAEKFAGAQTSTIFSRDPYLQLEKYYENIGDDTQARRIHYEGRLAFRNAKKANRSTDWSIGKNLSDWFFKVFTGYGVRTHRVLVLILAFLIVGAIVFSLDRIAPVPTALVATSAATSTASVPALIDRVIYDVDLFIPVVSIQAEQAWEPHTQWFRAYAAVHALAGWLLIPLFLASWSGLVRVR